MDPDETLRRLRTLVAADPNGGAGDDELDVVALFSELCATFDNLDAWLTRSGKLPRAWKGARP